jgi:hypothetical protein
VQNQEPVESSQTPKGVAAKTKNMILLSIGAVAAIIIGVVIFIMITANKEQPKPVNTTDATALFYDMVVTASQKIKAGLTYAERDFDSKAQFDAHSPSGRRFSVAELDSTTKEYRAVFADQIGNGETARYIVRRCIDGKTLEPDVTGLIQTLEDMQDVIKGPFKESTGGTVNDCDVADPRRIGRISDGVMPLGLTTQQADALKHALKESEFLVIEDGGSATYQQKPVRKLKLTTNSIAGTGSFSESVKQSGIQLTTDKGEVGPDSYHFDDMATSDNVQGYFLVDEQTKLPVYSEFTSVGLLDFSKQGRQVKQQYVYPDSLTITRDTPLTILE